MDEYTYVQIPNGLLDKIDYSELDGTTRIDFLRKSKNGNFYLMKYKTSRGIPSFLRGQGGVSFFSHAAILMEIHKQGSNYE